MARPSPADDCAAHAPPERTLYRSALLSIGKFRCPIGHPAFHAGAVNNGNLVVFPRTSVIIEQAGAKPVVADPNTAVLYNDHQPYRRTANHALGDRCEWFAYGAATVVQAIAGADPSVHDREDRPFHTNHAFPDRMTYLHQRELVHYLERTARPDPLFVDEVALSLLQRVVGGSPGRGKRPGSRAKARKEELADAARQLLAREVGGALSLSELAQRVGCSEFHLCRAFSASVGTTLHRYRDQLRLRSALQRLSEAGESLTAIALDLGYSSHSHFTSRFHRAFGLTPSRYRANASVSLARKLSKNLIADRLSPLE
ncbi:MAG: helix-turn-helix transcriptional regulator [Pseudomonadota bacterium]